MGLFLVYMGLDMRDTYTNSIIKVHYIWYYNVYKLSILIVKSFIKVNGKVVYGQEPPSGESTTTECGFNYQLLAVITEVSQWGAPIVAVNHN